MGRFGEPFDGVHQNHRFQFKDIKYFGVTGWMKEMQISNLKLY